MNLFAMNYRECDPQGCGHYNASRGTRKHKGVDMACVPGTEVGSPVRGVVTKLGYPYEGDMETRYVEVTAEKYKFRVFYVEPCVSVGDDVLVGTPLGKAQFLESMARGGTQHVHFEIMHPRGHHIDPTPVIIALRGTLGE